MGENSIALPPFMLDKLECQKRRVLSSLLFLSVVVWNYKSTLETNELAIFIIECYTLVGELI